MHRRAHGGAWGAAALLIGGCSFVEAAEPPRTPTKYSSGTQSNSAHLSGVSSFSAAGTFSPMPTSNPISTVGQMIDIVPTPIVPSASALSLRGQVFSPATVAHVPHAPQVLPPSTIGLTPTDLSGANVQGTTMPKVTTIGPMVPVNLSPQEKELLEKALRGAGQTNQAPLSKDAPTKSPGSNEPVNDPFAPTNSMPTSPTAKPKSSTSVLKPTTAAETSAAKQVVASLATSVPTKTAEVPESEKIVPLPPLEREVPSTPAVPLNLPQPPIPLEFPRTGR